MLAIFGSLYLANLQVVQKFDHVLLKFRVLEGLGTPLLKNPTGAKSAMIFQRFFGFLVKIREFLNFSKNLLGHLQEALKTHKWWYNDFLLGQLYGQQDWKIGLP